MSINPTKEQQAIAREARIKIAAMLPSPWTPLGEQECEAIILAAIEEVYRQGVDDMDRNWREREKLDAAAQPQEQWTREIVAEILSGAFDESDEHGRGLKAIADAHNAALEELQNEITQLQKNVAAERQRREQADAKLARVLSFLLILFHDDKTAEHQQPLIWKEIETIGDQPAYLIKQLRELRGKLLSAQVALGNISKLTETIGGDRDAPYLIRNICSKVDFSALQKHDAELKALWEKEPKSETTP